MSAVILSYGLSDAKAPKASAEMMASVLPELGPFHI